MIKHRPGKLIHKANTRPPLFGPKNRTGETRIMQNQESAKVIANCYNNRYVIVQFEDGTVVQSVLYSQFKKGQVSKPLNQSPETKDKTSYPIYDDMASHYDWLTPQQIKINRTLLFKGFIRYDEDYSHYFYIEKEDDKYFFKYGVSMLGVQLQPFEDNRLNVLVKDEKDYQNFKTAIYPIIPCCHWQGHSEKCIASIVFFDDKKDYTPIETKQIALSVREFLHNTFIIPVEQLKEKVLQYEVIDSYSFNGRLFEVIHDKSYKAYDLKLPKQSEEEIIEQFKETFDKYMTKRDKWYYTVLANKMLDVMQEATYVYRYSSYPFPLVTIRGWTVKDLIESNMLSFHMAYNALISLKFDEKDGIEQIKQPSDFLKYYKLLSVKDEPKPDIEARFTRVNRDPRQSGLSLRDLMDSIAEMNNSTSSEASQLSSIFTTHDSAMFLSLYTIPLIKEELSKYIIGQDELIEHAAQFIYYHMLRLQKPELFPRPFLIAGPSGSGKTEVWRVAKKVFNKYLSIEIIDGSTITQEGWKGSRKLSSYIESLSSGTILVIDEFDKLVTPNYNSSNENVSQSVQAEFLKIMEGDYYTKDLRRNNGAKVDVNTLGFVLVGSFDAIRNKKESEMEGRVGFGRAHNPPSKQQIQITNEDLVQFGMIPELVGRVADICITRKLTAEEYLTIIKNEHSRVQKLSDSLKTLGIDTADVISDQQILDLAEKSQVNMLGVRWVSSQIETMLLKLLAQADIRQQFSKETEKKNDDVFDDEFML